VTTDRALALLAPAARPAEPQTSEGFLDLLGARVPASTGLVQNFMLSRAVPRIYERYWRPALGRVFKGGPLGPSMAGELQRAIDLLALSPGHTVLDLACGPGNFTRRFAKRVGPDGLAVGIDASPTMLRRAVLDGGRPRPSYVLGDAVRLPFADATFDGVCCFAALHLFEEPMVALDHVARVLKPGGRVAIFASVERIRGPLGAPTRLAGLGSGIRVFGRDELPRALEARGFGEVRQELAGLTQFVGARLAG
jgi:SAM-dependent methyltransferase